MEGLSKEVMPWLGSEEWVIINQAKRSCVYVLSCFSIVRLCNTMVCSLPGSSVHGILQTRILEGVATLFSRDLPDWD